MLYKKYSVQMELTGLTRKKAAEILSDILKNNMIYDGNEDIYKVLDNLERTWTVYKSDKIQCQKQLNDKIIRANPLYSVKLDSPFLNMRDFEILENILAKFKDAMALTNETTDTSILIETNICDEKYVNNIKNVMKSKGELLFKAVGSVNKEQPIVRINSENKKIINFPMFNSTLEVSKLKAYLQLSQAVNNYCSLHTRVVPRVNESPNEKYTFRTWLLRLKMIGDEYKTTRKELVKNLVGNTAWRNYEINNETEIEIDEQPKQSENADILNDIKF